MDKFIELVVVFLNSEFYYSESDNCVYSISNNDQKVGYQQIENIVKKVFNISEDWAHAITFNWLLGKDVPLVRKNWNKTYIVHNLSVYEYHNQTITEDIDFVYKLIPKDPTREMTITL